MRTFLGKAKELHVIGAPDRDGVSNVGGKDTLNIGTPDGLGESALRGVLLDALGLVVVVAENTGPLLHRLGVVLGAEGGIDIAVVDLHLRARAGVASVHVGHDLGPRSRCLADLALSAVAVPGSNSTRRGREATGWHSVVNDGSLEQLGVGCSHNILC